MRPGRSFWLTGPLQGEVRTAAPPTPGDDEVLLEGGWSGVSRGTESLIWRGAVPETLQERMRCPLQRGSFPWPVAYGYSRVGRAEGRWAFALAPHADPVVVPRSLLHPLPDGLPPARAVLAANMETALNAVWDASPGPGDRVAIVGAGVVGALVGWLVGRIPGTTVTLVDVADRTDLAATLGLGAASPSTAPGDQDLVVHTSGTAAGLGTALGLAGEEALVLELSWYGDQPVPAPLGAAFHPRRLTLRSSQVGALPPARRPRWDFRRRMGVALDLLQDSVLDVLIDSESTLEDLPSLLAELPGRFCHRITYSPT